MGETSKGKAKRMKNCTPSKIQSCIQTQPIMNPILKDAAPVTTSLYCFSTYMAETGQTKKSVDELGNLQLQYKRDIGIFQCDPRCGRGPAVPAAGADRRHAWPRQVRTCRGR